MSHHFITLGFAGRTVKSFGAAGGMRVWFQEWWRLDLECGAEGR